MPSKKKSQLALRERDLNAFRAGLQLIPNVGPAIEKLIFGNLDDLRIKRVEDTLREIGQLLESQNDQHRIEDNEDFGNFLQDVVPPLSRSTNEDRRKRFRDLILQAAQVPAGDARWEQVHFVSKLLDSIAAPGLAILAVMARCRNERVSIFAHPRAYIFDGQLDWNHLDEVKKSPPPGRHVMAYDWVVVEEWVIRLKELRIVWLQAVNAQGGFHDVQLTQLGQMLVRWAVSDRLAVSD